MWTRTMSDLLQRVRKQFLRQVLAPSPRGITLAPRLEPLEDRWMPAVCRFNNPAGGAWELAANWTACNGGIPQAGDEAVIGNLGQNMAVTRTTATGRIQAVRLTGENQNRYSTNLELRGGDLITNTLQVSSAFSLTLNGGTLTVNSLGSYSVAGSTFNYIRGTIRVEPSGAVPPFVLTGSQLNLGTEATSPADFVFRTGNVFNGTVHANQRLLVQGTLGVGPASLTVTANSVNRGIIWLGGNNSCCESVPAELHTTQQATLSNESTGVIRADGNSAKALRGNFTNQLGGVIEALGGIRLPITGAGVYEAAGGRLQGDVYLIGQFLRVTASPVGATLIKLHAGNTLLGNNLAGTELLVEGRSGLGGATLAVSANTTNHGVIHLAGNNTCCETLAATLAIPGGVQMTNVGGIIANGNSYKAITGHLINRGQVTANVGLAITAGTYEADGGQIVGDGYVVNSTVRVTSSPSGGGTIKLHAGATLLGRNRAGTTLLVQGRQGFGGANLTVSPDSVNEGTIYLDGNNTCCDNLPATLTVPQGHQLSNRGTVIASGNSTKSVAGYLINGDGGVLSAAGGARLALVGTLEADGGTTQGDVYVWFAQVRVTRSPATGTTIVLRGASALLGDNQAGTTLYLHAGVGYGSASLTMQPNSVNSGTIWLEASNTCCDAYQVTLIAPAGSEIRNNGTLGFSGTSSKVLQGRFLQAGTIDNRGAPVRTLDGTFVNTPESSIVGWGSIDFTQTPFFNEGRISVPRDGQLSLGGQFLNYQESTLLGGTYEIEGTLRANVGNVATLAATVELNGPASNFCNYSVCTPLNTMDTIRPEGSLAIRNRGFTRSGNLTNNGRVSTVLGDFVVTANYNQGSDARLLVDRGRFRIQGSFQNYEPVQGTLTGGNYHIQTTANVGASLQFANANVRVSNASLRFSGMFPAAVPNAITDLNGQNGLRSFSLNRGQLLVDNGRNHELPGRIANEGTVTVGESSTLTGTFTNLSGTALTGGTYVVGGTLRFTNGDGELRTLAAALTLLPNGRVLDVQNRNLLAILDTIAETGRLTFGDNAVFSTFANLTNAGLLSIGAGADFRVASNFTVANTGTVRVQAGGRLAADVRLTNFDTKTGRLAGGTYLISGTFQFGGANVRTNAANFTLDGPDAVVQSVAGLPALRNFAANENVFTLQGGASLALPGTFTNRGTMAIQADSVLALGGDYTQTEGATVLENGTIDGTLGNLLINAGGLSGTGTILGSVVNAGLLVVGGLRAAGTLTITGDYTQTSTGTLNMELGGTAAGAEYDQLVVGGLATLDGALILNLLPDYFPGLGDCFDLLTAGSLAGTFATTTLPDLGVELFFDPLAGESGFAVCVNAR